ncbi:MAG: nuclease-like protein [Candidatus Peregrinibacteria bacterium Greene0416_62]|nr:MAG: nuclease-like protein [Candidatus Peregrinibacteria bacterium Greene0416_62]TSD00388.1 MAG: nuclease-like protein [Candidatus Peregrinibacteria bacterium Greene1014_49]
MEFTVGIPFIFSALCNAFLLRMHCTFRTLGIGMLLVLLLRAVPSAYARAVISEVMWAGTDLSSADEWVELACEDLEEAEDSEDSEELMPRECFIGGWSLTYLDSKNVEQTMVTFSSGTVIGYGKYFLVSNFSEAESRLAIVPNIVTSVVSIPNTKLLLRLRDAFNNIMDEVDDGIGDPFAGLNLSGTGTKASMERLDVLVSGTLKSNWVTASISNNLDSGFPVRGTPGAAFTFSSSSAAPSSAAPAEGCCSSVSSSSSQSTSSISNLFITEILPNPEGSDTEEWIEIGNIGSSPLAVAGLLLSTGTGATRKMFAISSDASGGLLFPQTFRSFRNHQSHLTLPNDGTIVTLLSGDTVIDTMMYPGIAEGMSYGRSAGSGSWRVYCIPTEREANVEKPIGLSIMLQSGNLDAEEQTSINVSAAASYPQALSNAQCQWEYPDGFAPETCNPPSHALSMTGVHLITLRAQLACGREERATVTVRIRPEDEQLMSKNPPPRAYAKNSIRISAAVPYSSSRNGRWVALRNVSEEAIDLTGFSLHGGLIPNDRHTFSGVILFPREERRFPGEMLRMDFPLPGGSIFLRDPSDTLISLLPWTEVKDGTIVRQPVTPVGSIAVQVLRVLDGDTFDVRILDTKDPDLPASVLHRWSAQELSPSPSLHVRLIGIDASELFYASGEISHSGLESLNSVRALTENQKIELQFDSIVWDRYERILAYALLPNSEELLQTALLRSGNAFAEREFPHPYQEYFIAMEEEAKLQKKGLWASSQMPTFFTHVQSVVTAASSPSSVFPQFLSLSSSSSFSSSQPIRSIVKNISPVMTPAVLASQTKMKWRVQAASSANEIDSGSSLLSSGSLLARLNILDAVSEQQPEAIESSIPLSLAERFLYLLEVMLQALRSIFT